jgi:hypothetical protein
MESFDWDAAHLVRFSVFDTITLILHSIFGDVDEQLDTVEAKPRMGG